MGEDSRALKKIPIISEEILSNVLRIGYIQVNKKV